MKIIYWAIKLSSLMVWFVGADTNLENKYSMFEFFLSKNQDNLED